MAEIEWLNGTLPCSARFNDPYYSRQDGLGEARYVFLQGNNLVPRLASCENFVIAELGFGTGLNFLAALQLWQQIAPAQSRLTFLSFEQYPISASDMTTALSAWPELGTLTPPLTAAWKTKNANNGQFDLKIGNAQLTVFLGDANIRLPQQSFAADAWFLDGFSPAKNPELWNETLIRAVFEHSAPGGTLATYSAAGWVRRNLDAAGFRTTRAPGHGGKRQMTIGRRDALYPEG